MLTASTDIQFLKGVGEKRAELLRKKGIDTVGALLRFYPRAYLDWKNTTPISECPFDTAVCIKAKIISPIEQARIRQGMTLFKFIAEDESGQMSVTLFNQKFLAQKLHTGSTYLFHGKLGGSFIMRQMSAPDIREENFMGIEPIYIASDKMPSSAVQRLVKTALSCGITLEDALPPEVVKRAELCEYAAAVNNIHFPLSREALERAKKRLVFEELFVLQTGLSFLKKRKRGMAGCTVKRNYLNEFEKMLPFSLTNAQRRVINECVADMSSGRPMNRLVQGDVGSGKTAVAAALCYTAAKNGFQSALMAPTEILAEQHYKTVCAITENTGIRCALLTGSVPKKQKEEIKKALKNGEIDLLVGTHALLTEDTEFDRLGLVITDEQHRFGVAQRGKLSAKGNNPHTLVMSATPIPRTLGLIIYGDLDISIIDEYPRGRQQIDTFCVNSSYRQRVYNYIKGFLNEGRQGYIVCPLVEENEALDITSAEEYYEKLKNGEFKVLVATTVIEVGIDVPNAVVMVIENAERFGLSQLHQLRGRIGRGSYKSSCILISDSRSEDTKKRLNVIKNNRDGFKIADEDLKLRGPGDFLGSRQHGLPDMKIADIFADREILHSAGREAEKMLAEDPALSLPEHRLLRKEIAELYKKLNQN